MDQRAALIAGDAALLARRDDRLEAAALAVGPLHITLRPEGHATIMRLILEQQVSITAARVMFERLQAAGGDTPQGLLALDDAALRRCGFSRQKAGYARAIACAVIDGEADLDAVRGLDDAAARRALMGLRGIGPWTADNYLLWALGRRDVFPEGDLALARGWSLLTGEPEDEAALRAEAAAWRPMRSAAAFLLWEYYLAVRSGRRIAAPH